MAGQASPKPDRWVWYAICYAVRCQRVVNQADAAQLNYVLFVGAQNRGWWQIISDFQGRSGPVHLRLVSGTSEGENRRYSLPNSVSPFIPVLCIDAVALSRAIVRDTRASKNFMS